MQAADEESRKAAASRIRDYIRQRGMDRDRFADKVRLSRSTVDKMLIGAFSQKALMQVEKNTGMRFGADLALVERAAGDLGGYAREETAAYPGSYLFVRRSHTDPVMIETYAFEIGWDTARPGLVLRQEVGTDSASAQPVRQLGFLAIPRSSPQIFVTSNEAGWVRLMILPQLDHAAAMFGVLLTVGDVLGGSDCPVVVPMALLRCPPGGDGLPAWTAE